MEMAIDKRNEFIEQNAGIVGDIIKKPLKDGGTYLTLAKEYGYGYDDLFNSGVCGMIEGIDEYDIEKATDENGNVVPLEAWVRFGIKKHISGFIAKWRKHDQLQNKVSMDKKIFNDDGSSTTIGDQLEDQEHTENYGMGIDHERVRMVLESGILSSVEQIAIEERFINGLKFREIDELVQEHLGNPKAKAFHFINTGLAKLREALMA